jgi:hypothetical protein
MKATFCSSLQASIELGISKLTEPSLGPQSQSIVIRTTTSFHRGRNGPGAALILLWLVNAIAPRCDRSFNA